MKLAVNLALVVSLFVSCSVSCKADGQNSTETAKKSPKAGWQDFQIIHEPVYPWWHKLLWYIPNRFMDLVDVFHVDAGVGRSFGAVVRVTRYVQLGYRQFSPASFRIGDFGRSAPYMAERSSEYGVSPFFTPSHQRHVCAAEVGTGLDLFIVGAYAGMCFDELADFVGGIFFLDFKDDDYSSSGR